MEWLETDGLGGFAMGSATGIPLRRYHALLITALGSPSRRVALVNSAEATLIYNGRSYPLSTFCFKPGVLNPPGVSYLRSFHCNPWPVWTYAVEDSFTIEHYLFMKPGQAAVHLGWRFIKAAKNASLQVRPFFTGRDYHALHRFNPDFNFTPDESDKGLIWTPYPSMPAVRASTNMTYSQAPLWFHNVMYEEDKHRGADYTEDLASPGVFRYDLSDDTCFLSFDAVSDSPPPRLSLSDFRGIRDAEIKRRSGFPSVIERSADCYIVNRGGGKTIIAGYPWFADWGRDTFISMRGLCLATGRLDDAEKILLQWTETLSEGMLPNRFLEYGAEAEYNSVDASLWFVTAAYDFLTMKGRSVSPKTRSAILDTIDGIVSKFMSGTRYNIKMDSSDGLLAAGAKGLQITWMDAKIGDYVVTPRIGKPVEIQALWFNALTICHKLLDKYKITADKVRLSFSEKFYNPSKHCLFDVIDCDHVPGQNDGSVRPNQLFAVGGLPFQLLDGERAEAVVQTAEKKLMTPFGPRSLAPDEPGYRERYTGDAYSRDTAYHQGTVWPWLSGAFIEAWVRVNSSSKAAKREARQKFLTPLLETLNTAGLGHISEIADANFPHVSRGCPFQAWSVGEALRADLLILK